MELKSVKRSEVDEKYTWDLSAMAKDENEFKSGLDQVAKDLEIFEKTYKGKIKDIDTISKMREAYEDIYQRYNRFAGYAYLQITTDQGNHSFQEYEA